MRAILERLARNRRIRRKLPDGTALYVSPDSQLKYLRGPLDPDLNALARTHVNESSRVWDIGANCGIFAFSARKARQIVAVEADPFLSNMIRDSAELNGAPVSVVTAAAYSKTGLAEFTIAQRGRASNHLASVGGWTQTGGARGSLVVPTIRLDDLLDKFEPPTFVKIDVESSEVEVLQGAARVLAARPLIYFEAGSSTIEACRAILKAAGYEMTQVKEDNWLASAPAA